MNPKLTLLLGALLLLGTGATGYWIGTHSGRTAETAAPSERKVLYYRNPMGLPDTSPVPKKDAMGMDYVPVYEGEDEAAGQLGLSLAKVQRLGVKSEAAALRELNPVLRVNGRLEIDERRTYTIAPKFEGWVEKLHVNTTGQWVKKGQPLFEVYSPELVTAQRELTLAEQGLSTLQDAGAEAQAGMKQLVQASRTRLRNWDIADAQIDTNHARPRVLFRAPAGGTILEKKAIEGMRFMPGEVLYQIADLSSLWVIADIPEQDIGHLALGDRVTINVDAYADHRFEGKVDFIYPTLDTQTRTVPVRMVVKNLHGQLKPAMYANVQIATGSHQPVLSVPTSAVIDSGTRQVILVRLTEGRFEPRTVQLGRRSSEYVEVLQGLRAGEQVVTSANFLIDAESNLKAALSGMSEPASKMSTQSAPSNSFKPESGKKSVSHHAHGTLDTLNEDGTVSITHEPIPSLGWPSMSMDFALANRSLAQGIAPESEVDFEIVERSPGDWVITRLQAQHKRH